MAPKLRTIIDTAQNSLRSEPAKIRKTNPYN
jgi:hypothetical protein